MEQAFLVVVEMAYHITTRFGVDTPKTTSRVKNLNFGDRLTAHSLVKLGKLHIASNLLTNAIDE